MNKYLLSIILSQKAGETLFLEKEIELPFSIILGMQIDIFELFLPTLVVEELIWISYKKTMVAKLKSITFSKACWKDCVKKFTDDGWKITRRE